MHSVFGWDLLVGKCQRLFLVQCGQVQAVARMLPVLHDAGFGLYPMHGRHGVQSHGPDHCLRLVLCRQILELRGQHLRDVRARPDQLRRIGVLPDVRAGPVRHAGLDDVPGVPCPHLPGCPEQDLGERLHPLPERNHERIHGVVHGIGMHSVQCRDV